MKSMPFLSFIFLSLGVVTSANAEDCSLPGGPDAIQAKRGMFSGSSDFLGNALIPATLVPRRDGCFVHYQGGSIYWSQRTPASEVHGDVRARWAADGWELGDLGFPITDALTTPDGIGRFNHFEGGSIYWTQNLGAVKVKGPIRDFWASLGWERNPNLGYPVSEEFVAFPGSSNFYQQFENGVLYYRASSGRVDQLAPFPLASRSVDQLEEELASVIQSTLSHSGVDAHIDGQVRIVGVEDYERNGAARSHERSILAKATIRYSASFLGIDALLPDPSTELSLKIRFFGRRSFSEGPSIYQILRSYEAKTHVPSPTGAFISAAEINAKLNEHLMPMVGVENGVATLPSSINLLHVGITKEGGLDVYIEPLL